MRSALLKTLVLSLGVLSLSSCMKSQLALNYSPAHTGIPAATRNTIGVGQIKDTRGVEPNLIVSSLDTKRISMMGGYQDTKWGKFTAEQPISTILQAGISQGLTNDGYRVVTKGSNTTLYGNLLGITIKSHPEYMVGRINAAIDVQFTLVNNHTGHHVWTKTIAGHGSAVTGTGLSKNIMKMGTPFADQDSVKRAFNQAMDSLIRGLESSNGFRRAVSH